MDTQPYGESQFPHDWQGSPWLHHFHLVLETCGVWLESQYQLPNSKQYSKKLNTYVDDNTFLSVTRLIRSRVEMRLWTQLFPQWNSSQNYALQLHRLGLFDISIFSIARKEARYFHLKAWTEHERQIYSNVQLGGTYLGSDSGGLSQKTSRILLEPEILSSFSIIHSNF